ncbi:2-amino-4-hydroxy-6-hydroxymethyldihydropteridine diphosphokinase [Muricauda sp. JGD-17]|uniref:2-amino-4-hydroxy-6-hydroxymethyldihydropteridine pyrophosphokinase n=1 Tax=Flagellimonas ochracea TaxID=2696472 RepID=A0A964TCB6_9FLAO|nr:2-amino-4-hydroxy-6-hydroxymethyldihydropteridine diphosphokinase [Allomuricauda ochracea]NAY92262.1 2-amino-4-hydroxy-6-hydroxymethyldihydropteridine diphosphokinase [Allomuricauda ochracea]
MGLKHRAYLSLGSNLGNRFAMLQKAVLLLQQRAGEVLRVSAVYQNPAAGFEGNDFFNTALLLATHLSPEELLSHILQLEKEFGRVRGDQGYQSRTLDIDIILYDDEIIQKDNLSIPHPLMHERNFVLKPLADIAPQLYHPVLNNDIRNLLQQCSDRNSLTKTKHKLFKNRLELFSQLQFMAIEGNIGAGKTTLSKMIATDFNAKLVLERFADNPFLPKFYEDQTRYAFPLEMSFLADRYQQFTDDTSQFDLFKNFMVSDYDIFKSLIFAKITLQADEFELYRKLFTFMYREVKKPEVYLYLYQDTEQLLANIKKRGRDYEKNISADYLEKINRGYLDFLKSHPQHNSLILNMNDVDFVNNASDYEAILNKIEDHVLHTYF